jgi:putative ABC transport system permease protein
VDALVALGPAIPRIGSIAVDGGVLLFALAVTGITGVLFGLAPALRLSRPELRSALGERGRGTRRESRRLRSALVVAEVALSLVLLVGAGLMVRSFTRLLATGPGFDPERLLVASIEAEPDRYGSHAERARFFEALAERVARLPGVEAASAITFPPLAGGGSATYIWANDRPVPPPGELPVADIRWVHRDYFRTLGIPVLLGRVFDEGDHAGAPLRVVVSRAMAQELWPGTDPLGKTISMPWGDTLVAEVIGVVGDVRHQGPGVEPRAKIYWDHRQFQPFTQMSLVVRTAGEDPLALVPQVRAELREMDPDLPLYGVSTMESLLEDSVARTRFAMLALGGFAAVALILAAIGIYGVMSYAVGQRTREIGVRMALGARRADIARMVLGEAFVLVWLALMVGLAGASALARLLEGLIYGVGTSDPVTLAGVSALLALTALVATWLPARRASRVAPVEAMREE